jgi:hypothetical protein
MTEVIKRHLVRAGGRASAPRTGSGSSRRSHETLAPNNSLSAQYETETPAVNGNLASFEREVAAFEALDPQIQGQYAGKAVAIYRGQIVADGDSKLAVLDAVLARFGQVPCYVDWMKSDGPRRARVPSVWIAQ